MLGALVTLPAERIAKEPRQRRGRGKLAHDADMVDGHATEGHQRRSQAQVQPAVRHAGIGTAVGSPPANCANSASVPRAAPDRSRFTSVITRRCSPVA